MNSEEEFFDAVTGFDSDNSSGEFSEANQRVSGMIDLDASRRNRIEKIGERPPQENGIQKHRTALPAPMFTRSDFSVWSILKKCIGLELSKITMPIAFNEPLSFLQRITEYMEHVSLIHKASCQAQPLERMQSVAAFAVSAVASQWERTGKPFNPLLGETYELTREDLGFRFISEQVSHHPPISAFYSEGLNQDFVFHGSIYPKLKFWGKSVEAEPRGTITLELLKHNEAYTWTNPTCCVHNVIIGKLWIEQYGTVEIVNHRTGDKCVLNFKSCGLFGKELHKVEGHIQDRNKKKLFLIYGKWTECLWGIDVAALGSLQKQEKRGDCARRGKLEGPASAGSDEADDVPNAQETVQVLPGSKLLWRVNARPPNSAQMYNFTSFAVSLNELQKGMEKALPPTDCRLRPDIRGMELGNMDLASREKERLEEKQREARRERAREEAEWQTRMTTSGALFPSLVPGSRGSSTKYLVEFRAGKMSLKGTTVTPDKRKGLVYIQQTDDSLIHFCWKDRTSGNVEDDLIIFPDDCEFKRVPQCPSGRVYVLKFKAGSKRLFFWMQEPKTDQDEEHCRKVNECLNNPPMPGALGASGSGGHELSALGGEGGLQSLLGNMSHSQLMQLIGPAGLGGLGGLGALTGPGLASLLGSGGPPASSSSSSSRSQSAAVTPSSATSSARATPAPSAPAATSAASPSPAPSSGSGTSPAASPTQPIQLSDLQNILATMNVPAGAGGGQQVDLASVLTPEIMAPILANADVQERLLPYLPSGESLPQTAEEIQNTLTSPQFQQALGMFSAALASGQLGPLMCQFGLPAEAVEAASRGDVEAFAKAMQNSAKSEQSKDDPKDKKDEEEDMSLD
ncbi:proteasomal ubiquitin receptor ADRM1 [Dasypus novemcinctus]|uniref:proteasomal ubiquitin receptor ADRM1 n=1 Tax=Dasypus novemcinctus TaxID=9361 RepID=UPI0026603F47|nr:proteasomal ubiquitin receptor ADRM1 [Dasypus novemcinctus]XP_058143268.1 proteasomal ubiquitin receptor ADRM1 [Dasypus novemcinctus]